jgi:PASTA domain
MMKITNRTAVLGAATLVGLAVLIPAAVAAPPANEAFATAQVLSGNAGSVLGTNADATKEPGEPNHAGEQGGHSVWYRWTAPSSGHAVFDTCSDTRFDTMLAVYAGATVSALTEVASSDDGCGTQSLVSFAVQAGTEYAIAVDGYDGGTGAFTLRWQAGGSPLNDTFAARQPLVGASGTISATNLGSGVELGEPALPESRGTSVWFTWTAPVSGTARFETCGSSFDTLLAAHTGAALAELRPVAYNDDSCGRASRVRFAATAGTAYQIVVSGTGSADVGEIRLSWLVTPRPPNDDFAKALRIRGLRGSIEGRNDAALAERGEPDIAEGHASVWYRWRAPVTGGIAFDTCASATFDTVVAVYRGPRLSRAVMIDWSDDRCADDGSRVVFPVRRGVDYVIVVDSSGTGTGGFTLSWGPPAAGEGRCNVPDIRGLRVAAAGVALERADCVLGRALTVTSGITPRGRVVAQYPLPGTRLRFRARVNVEVSGG